ncbi:hypothetical protein QCA50_013311 [Cerrena zonata]|uniref:Glycoside hydrolase family 76 protein n=1 Tax=Cerrena zonata TaxID=2478898 RepID=A0AAW0FVX5_9APHY
MPKTMALYTLLALFLLQPLVLTQNLSFQTQWIVSFRFIDRTYTYIIQNTTSTSSGNERIQVAQKVIDTLIQSSFDLDHSYHMMSALATYDYFTSGKTNYATVVSNLLQASAAFLPSLQQTSALNIPLDWGLSAMYAYRAYQETTFLHNAIAIWEIATPFSITTDDASAGYHPLRQGAFGCNDTSVAGGVFLVIDNPQDMDVNTGTVGAYMMLSAYLFEATANQTYYDAADLSRRFIRLHLYDNETGITMDTFSTSLCSLVNPGDIYTYNTALHLEGVAVLANSSQDLTLTEFADELSIHAMSATEWVAANGTITETTNNGRLAASDKGMLIRALLEHWFRRPNSLDVARLVESFITIQYNALLSIARTPGTDIFSQSWCGPPTTSLLPASQLGALDVFNSVIGLANDSQAPSPSIQSSSTSVTMSIAPTATSPISSTSHDGRDLGLIIGLTIGCVIFLCIALVIVVFTLFRCRKVGNHGHARFRRSSSEGNWSASPESDFSSSISPFSAQIPSSGATMLVKLRMEIQPDIQPILLPVQNRLSEPPVPSQESIRDLVYRLNQAISQLPPPVDEDTSSIGPPQYQSVL